MVAKKSIVAVVEDIVSGKHGLYVVVTSESLKDGATFSLESKDNVWKEKDLLKRGTVVVLDDIRKVRLATPKNSEKKFG